jgi:transcriptional regulator GlxA family with amidase domain
MATITILAEEGCASSAITGIVDSLAVANLWRAIQGHSGTLFSCRIVTVDGKPVTANGSIEIKADCSIHEAGNSDMIILPGFLPPFDFSTERIKETGLWLKERHLKGTTIAAICTGSFILAESGLLDGRNATTNWQFAGEFGRKYPKVNLKADEILVEDSGLICTGAASAFLNLCLEIIERYGSKELACLCSRSLLIDADRKSQAPYMMRDFFKGHADNRILKAQQLMERKIAGPVCIDEIAGEVSLSPRHFKRRFKKATGDSPLAYLQNLRVETAKKHLEGGMDTVNEIAFMVGYEDVNSFRKVFKKIVGMPPKDYRAKFSAFSAQGLHN